MVRGSEGYLQVGDHSIQILAECIRGNKRSVSTGKQSQQQNNACDQECMLQPEHVDDTERSRDQLH
ncbi:uncharacterized protein PHALS_09362 [Plasmopara halstedii]|uniref:Uncharacterized protein n=1 Tax=Plasmopara halstedii TaxID=4781 RepID=A0A0P1AE90_PLAHL|nr:uncharacterized protein PHALS_09362 [Plasmopara halstedii]CEG39313.1 hypothetical protein PHALS_09362 [Plasmopara halstedii]|eukprot:XP_024575682.1 hypothetical protein PHALS_09362 [Plasmopara halstedii]